MDRRDPLDDISYDDPMDQRIFSIVKDTITRYEVPLDRLPLKQLENKLYSQPNIEPEALDRSYLEAPAGYVVEWSVPANVAVGLSGAVTLIDITYTERFPVFWMGTYVAHATSAGVYQISNGYYLPGNRGILNISNSSSAQNFTTSYMAIRPRR